MSKQTNNVVSGKLEYRQFIVLEDGTSVQVRYNQDPTLYEGTDVQLYKYTAKEGKGTEAVEVERYAVAVEDAKRAKRVGVSKSDIQAILSKGLSAEEVMKQLAEIVGK